MSRALRMEEYSANEGAVPMTEGTAIHRSRNFMNVPLPLNLRNTTAYAVRRSTNTVSPTVASVDHRELSIQMGILSILPSRTIKP